jgi:hypothetical protein
MRSDGDLMFVAMLRDKTAFALQGAGTRIESSTERLRK